VLQIIAIWNLYHATYNTLQRLPESYILIPHLFLNVQTWVRNIFNFDNPTPVQTPATVDSTEIQERLNLSNDNGIDADHTDSCYRQKEVKQILVLKNNAEACRSRLRFCGHLFHVVHNMQLLKAY